MKLHLGVMDVLYKDGDATTGDVAQILEDDYHVMETFVEMFGQDVIAASLAASARTAVEDLMSGAPAGAVNLTFDAEQGIETAFRDFIDKRMFDGKIPGVPTEAARKGVNHRLAHPYVKSNPERPSFVDTGLYSNTFKAWTED